jgi:hypothetical protein
VPWSRIRGIIYLIELLQQRVAVRPCLRLGEIAAREIRIFQDRPIRRPGIGPHIRICANVRAAARFRASHDLVGIADFNEAVELASRHRFREVPQRIRPPLNQRWLPSRASVKRWKLTSIARTSFRFPFAISKLIPNRSNRKL